MGKPERRAFVMDACDVERATWRIAHEVVEHNRGTSGLVLVGLQTGGVWLAKALAGAIGEASREYGEHKPRRGWGPRLGEEPGVGAPGGAVNNGPGRGWGPRLGEEPGVGAPGGAVNTVPVGTLDVAYYRDDIGMRPVVPVGATEVPVPLDGAIVVLADDVLFTGRTVRAALNALSDLGRPASVQLAVMVDRGHRELPIRPDYVGKNLPTRRDEIVDVSPNGVVIREAVTRDAITGDLVFGVEATR